MILISQLFFIHILTLKNRKKCFVKKFHEILILCSTFLKFLISFLRGRRFVSQKNKIEYFFVNIQLLQTDENPPRNSKFFKLFHIFHISVFCQSHHIIKFQVQFRSWKFFYCIFVNFYHIYKNKFKKFAYRTMTERISLKYPFFLLVSVCVSHIHLFSTMFRDHL